MFASANISFWPGMTATPLQIATATVAFATGGIVYRPHILCKVVSPDRRETLLESKPEGHRVLSTAPPTPCGRR